MPRTWSCLEIEIKATTNSILHDELYLRLICFCCLSYLWSDSQKNGYSFSMFVPMIKLFGLVDVKWFHFRCIDAKASNSFWLHEVCKKSLTVWRGMTDKKTMVAMVVTFEGQWYLKMYMNSIHRDSYVEFFGEILSLLIWRSCLIQDNTRPYFVTTVDGVYWIKVLKRPSNSSDFNLLDGCPLTLKSIA